MKKPKKFSKMKKMRMTLRMDKLWKTMHKAFKVDFDVKLQKQKKNFKLKVGNFDGFVKLEHL